MADDRCPAVHAMGERCWNYAWPIHDRHYAKTPWGALEWTENVAARMDLAIVAVKAQALRDAADALQHPTEGASYEMWASGVGDWLRARATILEEQARSDASS